MYGKDYLDWREDDAANREARAAFEALPPDMQARIRKIVVDEDAKEDARIIDRMRDYAYMLRPSPQDLTRADLWRQQAVSPLWPLGRWW